LYRLARALQISAADVAATLGNNPDVLWFPQKVEAKKLVLMSPCVNSAQLNSMDVFIKGLESENPHVKLEVNLFLFPYVCLTFFF
jgi:hypothetical protein